MYIFKKFTLFVDEIYLEIYIRSVSSLLTNIYIFSYSSIILHIALSSDCIFYYSINNKKYIVSNKNRRLFFY